MFGKLQKAKNIYRKMLLVESHFYPKKIIFITQSVAGIVLVEGGRRRLCFT